MHNLVLRPRVNRSPRSVAYKQQANSSLESAAATPSASRTSSRGLNALQPLLIGNAQRDPLSFGSRQWQNASKATQSSILPWACRLIRGGKQESFYLSMDDGLTLFLSLPVAAQSRLRARVDRGNPDNVRDLTRVVYAWVQTLAEAECIAGYLVAETHPAVSSLAAELGKFPRTESMMCSVPTVQA